MAEPHTGIAFGDHNHGLQVGQSYGPIHVAPGVFPPTSTRDSPIILVDEHATLARPETPAIPSSNVPSRRDPDFVERTTLADRIDARLSQPAARLALVGLGGVGKSQLASEQTRQVRGRSPDTWVFWVHASNATRFDESLREVADQIKLPGRNDPKADLLQLLRIWLRDQSKGSWLIVLDNADDVEFLLAPPATLETTQTARRRMDYFPACEHGSMLITSRSKIEALKLVYESEIIEVSPMSESEAAALLRGKLGQTCEEALPLVRALECMPLAISQAAAYICARRPRCTVQQYRHEVEQSRRSRSGLLRRHVPLPDRDRDARNSVLLTWQISFEHIHQTRPSAAELLSFMSFCDRVAIPERLLREYNGDADTPTGASMMEEDIVVLRSFAFISTTHDAETWQMHRLVQDASQMWLVDRGRLEEVLGRFVHCLNILFPTGEIENWAICRQLLPHAQGLMEHQPTDRSVQLEWASVMYRCAWFVKGQGVYSEALEMARASTTIRSAQLGEEDEWTLLSVATVASVYRNQGRWKEAEELYVKVTETTSRVLGEEHPATLTSMANLASTYWNQGRWKEAEELSVKVVKTTRRVLGEEHPNTLASMAILASTYQHQGRWKEAEELDMKVIETTRRVLGEGHPNTLASIGNLASTYRYQGRWKEAEELDVKVIETTRRVLGEEHPDTLTSMANLSSTYRNQGRLKEAEELSVKVIETTRRVLGEGHPNTLASMVNLASTYWHQGRWKEAEELFVKVVKMRRRVLGEEHPNTLTSMADLASTYRYQGRWKEAEELDMKVIETTRRVLGEGHPDTLTSMGNLASTYRYQGRWKEAEELDVKVIETTRRVLGEEHPNTLASMTNLASTYQNQGRWKEAEELDVKVIETTRRVLGEGHHNTLVSMGNLASTYRHQGRWKEAEELFVKVVKTTRRVLGEEHPDTLASIGNLASTYSNQGRWKEAEELDMKVIETMRRVLGEEHPDTLTSMANLASTYRHQGRWTEAEELSVKVVKMRRRVLGEEHPDTLASIANLASIYQNQGRWKEAEALQGRALREHQKVYGSEHPHTRSVAVDLAHVQQLRVQASSDRVRLPDDRLKHSTAYHDEVSLQNARRFGRQWLRSLRNREIKK